MRFAREFLVNCFFLLFSFGDLFLFFLCLISFSCCFPFLILIKHVVSDRLESRKGMLSASFQKWLGESAVAMIITGVVVVVVGVSVHMCGL